MYESFFGLRERPFDLTPNPRFIYLSACHLEALSVVHYGIVGRKGITLVVGEAGTGKTTVIRTALEAIAQPTARCVYLSNPTLTRAEFYEFLAASFGLTAEAGGSKARFLFEFERLLVQRNEVKDLTALVIDEAQSLSLELLEEVRLLANLETLTDKLLPVVMAGQPELAEMLDRPELRQLKQRVALRADLSPLGARQVAAYVAGRIRKAGGDPLSVFTKEAIVLIHKVSGGIPRTISVVCDNAMLAAFAAGVKPVGPDLVAEVSRDFRLRAAPVTPDSGHRGNERGLDDAQRGPWHVDRPSGTHRPASGPPATAHPGTEARR
jgi:general secretion pathway protein A